MASIAIHSQQTPSSSTAALHRSPSLLGSIRSLKGTTISNIEPKCFAQASQVRINGFKFILLVLKLMFQVEIEFANLSNRYFALHISAPNGEKSETLEFSAYGQSKTFSPHQSGCGHGIWSFTLQCIDSKTQKYASKFPMFVLINIHQIIFSDRLR